MAKIIKVLTIVFTIGIVLELTLTLAMGTALGEERDQGSFQLPFIGPTATPTPTPAFSQPSHINIPSINLEAPVESIGVDEKNHMGVPTNPDRVGWYDLGTKIGWQGKAVFTGHYDRVSGAPAIFYNLHLVPLGAEITLTDDQGRAMVFIVDRSESRPLGAWTTDEVFGPTDERRIVLITCSGWWNPTLRNYSHRHMVFAKLRG